MSERYAREYLCPGPDEHGEIVYVPGFLRQDWRTGRLDWTALREIPDCPICGVKMVRDTDDRDLSHPGDPGSPVTQPEES